MRGRKESNLGIAVFKDNPLLSAHPNLTLLTCCCSFSFCDFVCVYLYVAHFTMSRRASCAPKLPASSTHPGCFLPQLPAPLTAHCRLLNQDNRFSIHCPFSFLSSSDTFTYRSLCNHCSRNQNRETATWEAKQFVLRCRHTIHIRSPEDRPYAEKAHNE